jgi:hypothetical protein
MNQKTNRSITRRELTSQAALLLLGGAIITISGTGCGGGDKTATPTSTPEPQSDRSAVVADNHGHEAKITSAQLTAGNGLNLNIQGTASHNHRVDLTGEEVTQVRSGNQVKTTTTTTDGHRHFVTFNPLV